MLPGTEESWWIRSAPSAGYPPLTTDVEVDVVVIGAGIAGLATAWEVIRSGLTVTVLEADQVVASVTGHTTAKLSSLHTLIYADVARSLGKDAARTYAESQQQAIEHVAAVSAELGIDCELERLPGFTYTDSEGELDKYRSEADAAGEAGLPASFVTETGLPFPVAGAVRMEDQAQFHPRKYLLGLAEDLVRRGGRIFEHTRAVELDKGDPCRVTTEHGATVTAGHVVVATHYPVFDRALLFTRLEPRRELVFAGPIPIQQDPQGIYITPDQNTRSVRTAPLSERDRLLIVTGEHFNPGAGKVTRRYERLAAWTQRHFPSAELTLRWATQDNTTTDKVPYIGPLHPGARNVWVAAGFGGWGMTNGVLAGQILAASIAGESLPWAHLYDPRRLHPVSEAVPALKLQARVARHFVGDRLSGSDVESVEEVPPGAGAVLSLEGERAAVYRDQTGALHAVSATCTHLGCTVHFNDAETAWECPCHGSRFDVDGSVIQGPANKPLPSRTLKRDAVPAPD